MDEKKFASRAGEKLNFAIGHFQIDVKDKICADFGSSIGGFTDCLLQHGAKKVYSVETGYGILAWKLRNDSRVVVMERTNAIFVKLPEKVDVLTIDVSWTRQKNILPNALQQLKDNGIIITLIKPHYEVEKNQLRKGKLDEKIAETVAAETADKLKSFGVEVLEIIKSPILGEKGGNTEYLAYLFKK